jgi:hypothetical protein
MGDRPSEDTLRLVESIYYSMHDEANRRAILEQLVLDYGNPKDWHDLLQLARNEKGLNDQQTMDIYRLRLWVGDIKTADEYQEMAQEAMVAAFPNEAKGVLDKASAQKLLNGERSGRLIKMANDSVAKDPANIADLQKSAAKEPDAGVRLGLILWTYGKNDDAENAIRAAMMKPLADPDAAKVALGHVLLSSGKKGDAAKAFDSVSKASKWASIARLEDIYARRGGEAAAPAEDEHRHDTRHDRHDHNG